jgi:hypothetical protein
MERKMYPLVNVLIAARGVSSVFSPISVESGEIFVESGINPCHVVESGDYLNYC